MGLLSEYVAYYQEFKTYNAMYYAIADNYGYNNAAVWQVYLCNMGSVCYAMTEFQLFIAWYLQFAQHQHPQVYARIINDGNIRRLYTLLEKENLRLSADYENHRRTILKNLGNSVSIKKGFMRLNNNGPVCGLHDEQRNQTNKLLSLPQQQILKELRIP